MEIRQLRALLTTVDAGSFTGAAVRLKVSQPTITHRIKTLERSLEAILLERMPGRVRPTTSGRTFLPYAREIVRLSEEAELAVAVPSEPHGRVSVGSPEILTSHRLLPLIEYLCVRYPKIDFSLHPLEPQDALSRLRDGQLDCAFLIGVEQSHEDLEFSILRPEPLALVVAPENGPGRPADAEEIFSTMLVCSDIDARHCLTFPLQGKPFPAPPRRMLKLNSLEAVKRSVANGVGAGLLPEVAVSRDITAGVLRKVPWRPPMQTYTQAVWRRGSIRHTALEVVLAAAEQVIRED
ncbi:LysR family transcriptional regulator [Micromonospora sp. WMMD1082]|uniref:LysR family transcriptional regulator n=1 Tax=Micromonospora sp. WMMD1082 TaxID=3016104 RepID=UPI002417BFA4|nr:LysR family transcriptional regulator [Micromonospora sp. WMMD1082]MDG4795566.1 LysR family transcriptional regulator [Micromonospora sp. WMMD1082]